MKVRKKVKMNDKKILVVGSINIDYNIYVDRFPEIGETVLGNDYKISYGGKGINQALCLNRLGSPVFFFGSMGSDLNSKNYLKIIKKEKLANNIKVNRNISSGTAFVYINKQGENNISVMPLANYLISVEDIDRLLKNKYEYLVLQLEIEDNITKYLIEKAKQKDIKIILNAAPAKYLSDDILSNLDYLIVNETELGFYTDHKVSDIDGILGESKKLLEKGVKNLIVTLGCEGALYINNKEYFHAKGNKVVVVDTVGAGDCFVGAFVNYLYNTGNAKDGLMFANKCASRSIEKRGILDSYPTLEELK